MEAGVALAVTELCKRLRPHAWHVAPSLIVVLQRSPWWRRHQAIARRPSTSTLSIAL